MATITAGDFRNGVTFEHEGQLMQVVEFQHVKPGKGAAFVRTKMKNVIEERSEMRKKRKKYYIKELEKKKFIRTERNDCIVDCCSCSVCQCC